MIVDTVAVKLRTLDALLPYPSCPSGLFTEQNPIYTHGYETSEYPILIIPNKIYDNSGNFLNPGYYSAALSDDKKFILLIESNLLKAKLPVASLVEEQKKDSELREEAEILQNLENAKIKRKKKKIVQYEDMLRKFKQREQAKMSAELFDSGKGYYILKYKKGIVRATGVILK